MSISQRIHDTIEDWQAEWKDRLKGWSISVLSIGMEAFFDILGGMNTYCFFHWDFSLTRFISSACKTKKDPKESMIKKAIDRNSCFFKYALVI